MCVLGDSEAHEGAGWVLKKVRAQPIGISAAPNMTGQARGEGERMAGRHIKARRQCLFRFGHGFTDLRGHVSIKFC
jgi:hypothetical protein